MTNEHRASSETANASTPRRFLLAGGGSGGHIAPGLAIAERLLERDPASEVFFLCSQRAIDARMIGRAGIPFIALPCRPLHPRPRALAAFLFGFHRSVRLSARLIGEQSFDHVLTLGGFVAAPVAAAARRAGVPVTLLNLDDPPGKANRLIARRCDEVLSATALEDTPGFASRVTGLPIRRCALASEIAATCRARLELDPGRRTLLVTGASQGAGSINALLEHLARTRPGIFSGWQVLHLSGFGADEPLRRAYAEAGIAGVVLPFLDEMGLAWGAADLAISRSGANSVGEAAANAVPCIFLPYPHHRDQHQRRNARAMESIGGAIILDDRVDARLNSGIVIPVLQDLLHDTTQLAEMKRRLAEHRPQDAAAVVADMLLGRSVGEEPQPRDHTVCVDDAAHNTGEAAAEAVLRS